MGIYLVAKRGKHERFYGIVAAMLRRQKSLVKIFAGMADKFQVDANLNGIHNVSPNIEARREWQGAAV
jgi:hypothetical protein